MFFSKLSVLAAVAFGAFASAIPLGSGLPLPDLSAVTGLTGGLPLPALGGIVPRDTPKSIAVVLTSVQAQLEPVTASLGEWSRSNCFCCVWLLT